MTYIFKLPDVGEGMAEGEISSWLVEVGDVVQEGDPILELQNDKLLQEIPSPVSGTVTKILVEPGTVSLVGDPLIEFDGDGSEENTHAINTATESNEQSVVAEKPPLEIQSDVSDAPVQQLDIPVQNVEPGQVLAMPSVRRYAYENGIDISTVPGTGKHGHITREDVEKYISDGAVTISVTDSSSVELVSNTPPNGMVDDMKNIATTKDNITYEKITPMRRAISNAMITSKHNAPHVTLFADVNASALVEHRNRFKELAADEGIKLTFLPYIVKALVIVAKKYPILNASFNEEKEEIAYKNFYNVGIATDTERGLMVPNIKDADAKGILKIASEITRLATAAIDGTITGNEMSNGTITISNIGSIGGGWFTPIINYPEVAILGVGRISKEAIVNAENEIVVADVLKLSLSFDHRLIDGATAQLAMNELKKLLEDPSYLLMS